MILSLGLILGGCASADEVRSAAPGSEPPSCAAGFAPACWISPEETTAAIAIRNGTRVLFGDANRAADVVSVQRICWSGEGDTDASTCVSNEAQVPEWIDLQRSNVRIGDQNYPALTIGAFQVADHDGELFVPLPATLTLAVGEAASPSQITLEVACCDLLGTGAAS